MPKIKVANSGGDGWHYEMAPRPRPQRPLRSAPLPIAGAACKYLGDATGNTIECGSCGGKTRLKVHDCAIHGKCTLGPQRGPDMACCHGCPDREPGAARIMHVMNHGLGDNVQMGIVLRHLRHYFPDDEQHVTTQRGKHSAFTLLAHAIHVRDDRRAPAGRWDRVIDHPWENPVHCYPDCPSSKAAHVLREVLHVPVLPELCRYEVYVGDDARRLAGQWVSDHVPTERFAILHYEGASWVNHKNLAHHDLLPLCDALLAQRITPIVLDLDGRSPLLRRRRIMALTRHDPLWNGIGTGDAEMMAALMGLSALNVMIDSGPGKVAASVAHVPCLTVWRELHPIHFSDLDYGQVLHLVPPNHADYLRGNKDIGLDYFDAHYRHRTFSPPQTGSEICAAALELLLEQPDELTYLVSRCNRWATMMPFLERLPSVAPTIVETGCMRQENDHGAGMATRIFGLHCARSGGRLTSVDLELAHVAIAQRGTAGLPVEVVGADSRDWLRAYAGPPIDGLYLDSHDLYVPGFAECCLEEIQAAMPHLAPGALVLIDDTRREPSGWVGKGERAVPWLLSQGWYVIATRHQVLLGRNSA